MKKSAGKEIFSIPEKNGAEIKREKVCLLAPFSTPTPVADRKATLVAIPEICNFTLGGVVEGYATEESDSDSDAASSVATTTFVVGGNSGRKGKETEDSDAESDDGSRIWEDTMREGWQEMAELCGQITDA